MTLTLLKKELSSHKNKEKAIILQGFFKTKKGEYGEGDIFLGLAVPLQRSIAKKYPELTLSELQELLESKIHEERLSALLILVQKLDSAKKQNNSQLQKEIVDFYLANTEHINNWDLVDLSSHEILGNYLLEHKKERKVLYLLAKSKKKGRNNLTWLWEKRIAIVATYSLIKTGEFGDTLKISKLLLSEEHDLLHKAVGWMLREVGKKAITLLESFLEENYKKMPRTTIRYAIERMSVEKKDYFLKLGK